jgi:diadenosine tetraphosphate (Ap4A) HIT family hydrolase
MASTVFGLIIEGKLPCTKVFENERILAIVDLYPVAPVHILIMPKKPIKNIQSLEPEDLPLVGEMIEVAQQIAEQKGIADGYRLLTNNGPDAGQKVFHLHFHLIGGAILGPMA